MNLASCYIGIRGRFLRYVASLALCSLVLEVAGRWQSNSTSAYQSCFLGRSSSCVARTVGGTVKYRDHKKEAQRKDDAHEIYISWQIPRSEIAPWRTSLRLHSWSQAAVGASSTGSHRWHCKRIAVIAPVFGRDTGSCQLANTRFIWVPRKHGARIQGSCWGVQGSISHITGSNFRSSTL